jgi:hypothetical protein
MPRIKIKTSTTTGVVPANGTLQQGELVANLADNRVWVGNASGNPVQLIDTIASQDSDDVSLTGGSINGTSVTATNVNTSGLALSGERLYYDEGTNAAAFTANWNDSTTYNMADFGGLGNVTAHGWTAGPRSYTLTLTGIPVHTEVRYQVFWHHVDSIDSEANELYTTNNAGTEVLRVAFTRNSGSPPTYSTIATGTTVSWNANRFYSYAPWGGSSRVVAPNGGNGYVVMDTGWYDHSASSFVARHYTGVDQAPTDEAVYLSHVKLWIRGATNQFTSIATTLSNGNSNVLPTQNAVKSYIDTNLGTTNSYVKNVFVFTSNSTYTKSGSDVKRVRVICVGGGGGGRGYGESGGAGGYAERVLGADGISAVAVTVGGGGAGGNYFGNSPAGGTTSFGSYVSATGGFGANNHGSHIGGHGGNGSAGDVISYGGGGKGHNNGVNNPTNSAVGRGGAGFFGGSRNSHHGSGRPADHGAPGGGGTASVGGSGGIGSDGRGGICIVYELR